MNMIERAKKIYMKSACKMSYGPLSRAVLLSTTGPISFSIIDKLITTQVEIKLVWIFSKMDQTMGLVVSDC